MQSQAIKDELKRLDGEMRAAKGNPARQGRIAVQIDDLNREQAELETATAGVITKRMDEADIDEVYATYEDDGCYQIGRRCKPWLYELIASSVRGPYVNTMVEALNKK